MTSIFTFFSSLFQRCFDFLESCTFEFFTFEVNLFGILLFFITCSVVLSIFWKGGKY